MDTPPQMSGLAGVAGQFVRDTAVSTPSATTTPHDMYMTPTELATVLLEAFKTLLSECESYVQYFEQRFRLEEEHVRAVKVMLERQRDLDMRINRKLAALPGLLPDPGRLSNLRNTWGDMRLSEIWGRYHHTHGSDRRATQYAYGLQTTGPAARRAVPRCTGAYPASRQGRSQKLCGRLRGDAAYDPPAYSPHV